MDEGTATPSTLSSPDTDTLFGDTLFSETQEELRSLPSPLPLMFEDVQGVRGSEGLRKSFKWEEEDVLGSGSEVDQRESCGEVLCSKSEGEVDLGQESKKLKSFKEEDDLMSESEVDLGEGSVEDSDYPSSNFMEEEIEDSETRDEYVVREEEAFYRHVTRKSHFFEVPYLPDRCSSLDFVNPYKYERVHGSMCEELEGYCKQAIDKYNDKKGTLYKLKYLIKMCGDLYESYITFALTDPDYKSFVGRVTVVFRGRKSDNIVLPMRVTKGEYRVPNWKDAKNKEFECKVNEVYREKLPELEALWKQKMHLK